MEDLEMQKRKLEAEISNLKWQLKDIERKIEYCNQVRSYISSDAVDADRNGYWDLDDNYHSFDTVDWEEENYNSPTQK